MGNGKSTHIKRYKKKKNYRTEKLGCVIPGQFLASIHAFHTQPTNNKHTDQEQQTEQTPTNRDPAAYNRQTPPSSLPSSGQKVSS